MKYLHSFTFILVVLQLTSVINISWFLVFLPSLLPVLAVVAIILGVAILAVSADKK